MNRGIGESISCQAVFYENAVKKTQGEYQRQTPREMSLRRLKAKLCGVGPAFCSDCLLCEYGKEYVRRTAQ